MRVLRQQRGQAGVEYAGTLALIAVIVAALWTLGLGGTISGAVEAATCTITGSTGCSERGERAATTADRAAGLRDPSRTRDGRFEPRDRETGGSADGGPQPGSGESGTGTPVPGTAGIPDAPADPPRPPNDGTAGEYGSEEAGFWDRRREDKFRAVADGADGLGLNNAARHMRHYLDGSGDPLDVSPEQMLRDLDAFRTQAQTFVQGQGDAAARAALDAYDGSTVSVPFTSPWQGYTYPSPFTKDWYYATGAFSYSVTGVATVRPPSSPGGEPEVTVDYRVHVFDRYNWDKGKSVSIGPFEVKDTELQELHRKGLAQEYDVRGSTDTQSYKWRPGQGGQPDLPEAGGRDGGRTDPGRPRG